MQWRHWDHRGLSNAAGAGERGAIPSESALEILRKWIYGDQGAHIRSGARRAECLVHSPTSLTLLPNPPSFQADSQGLITFYLGVTRASQQV